MEKKNSKISITIGFVIAFIGYSFWKFLWPGAFYHLISVALVCYTYTIHNECNTLKWNKLTFVPFMVSINMLLDELIRTPCVINWTEYVSIMCVILYICTKKKIS